MSSAQAASIVLLAGCVCFSQNAPSPLPRAPSPAFQALVREATARIKEVTAPQLQEMMQSDPKPILIDVREDNEWQTGHAAGAIHIGRGVLERDIENAVPQKDIPIILYCSGGSRSALAADTLQKMGYTKVFSLAGGLGSYRRAGLPVETGP